MQDYIGRNISRRRRAAKMTQEQLAERLGVSRVTLTRWEAGTRHPSIDRLPQITSVLGCDYNELFENQRNDCEKRSKLHDE